MSLRSRDGDVLLLQNREAYGEAVLTTMNVTPTIQRIYRISRQDNGNIPFLEQMAPNEIKSPILERKIQGFQERKGDQGHSEVTLH